MTAVPKKPKLTEAEYLAIERDAEFKSEFYNGEMFAMAGASREHNGVKENLNGELYGRLKSGGCRTYSSDMRVKVKRTGLYTYPDIVIVCGDPEFEVIQGVDTLLNPQVVFEILSDTTERYDRGLKFLNYQLLPSVMEYVLVSQDRKLVQRFVRQLDETWVLTTFDDPDGTFSLSTVVVSIAMADVYRNVDIVEVPLDRQKL